MPKRRRGVATKVKSDLKEKEDKAEEVGDDDSEAQAVIPEDGEEDEDAAAAIQALLASPVKSPAKNDNDDQFTTPVGIFTAKNVKLQSARTKLSGLLNRIQKQTTHEDSDSSQDEVPLSTLANKLSTPEPTVVPTIKIKSEPRSKRRRRKETQNDSVFHHTYVMKLFDRSVDLAQFKENTALYPVCRAWMANKPRAVKNDAEHDSEEEVEEDKSEKEEDNKEPDQEEEAKNVYNMPKPIPLKTLTRPTRVPSPIIRPLVHVIINEDADGSKDLLAEHLTHWRKVKANWTQAGRANENRFKKSLVIIEQIYKTAQEMQDTY